MKTFPNNLAHAVIGLGFGDEGKGKTTLSLCAQIHKPIVVRFSGGQQAGHGAHYKNKIHVHSNFGSGTLAGIPTFWTKFCSFDPFGFINELEILKSLITKVPHVYVSVNSPITTPYEKVLNQKNDSKNGTCGAGVGATYKREENFYSLLVGDLFNKSVFDIKFQLIRAYYEETKNIFVSDFALNSFLNSCEYIKKFIIPVQDDFLIESAYTPIFEGSQGLLLDQHFGFFPHVTPSNVGTKNILDLGFDKFNIFAVTRGYQTRHGNGPMTNEHLVNHIDENPFEINVNNVYQGKFRRTALDLDLLIYGIKRDGRIGTYAYPTTLVVNCLDHMKKFIFTFNRELYEYETEKKFLYGIYEKMQDKGLKFIDIIGSNSPELHLSEPQINIL